MIHNNVHILPFHSVYFFLFSLKILPHLKARKCFNNIIPAEKHWRIVGLSHNKLLLWIIDNVQHELTKRLAFGAVFKEVGWILCIKYWSSQMCETNHTYTCLIGRRYFEMYLVSIGFHLLIDENRKVRFHFLLINLKPTKLLFR